MGAHRTDPAGAFGHIDWGYEQRGEFVGRAAEYIADGLALGQQVAYIGDGDAATLRAELAAAAGFSAALAGSVAVKSVTEHYLLSDRSGVVDAERMTQRYANAAISAPRTATAAFA